MAGSSGKLGFKLILALSIAATAVILLAGWLPVFLRNQKTAREISTVGEIVARLYGPGRPIDEVRADLQRQQEELKARLAATRSAVEFVPDPRRFSLPAGATTPGLEYSKLRDRVESDLRDAAARANVALPPSLDPKGAATTPADSAAVAMLYRFAMNERIARAAIDCKVARVESLKYDLRKIDEDSSNSFVRTVQVEATVVGSTESVAKFLHSLQGKEGFLAPRKITIEPSTTATNAVKAVFLLEALRVTAGGQFPEELAGAPGASPATRSPAANSPPTY